MSWLKELPVPAGDLAEAAELAQRRASALDAAEQQDVQSRIDVAVARAYGLTEADLRRMEKAPVRPVQS